ncbi:MAG: hypothetical protein U0872_00770 [Planctomycetaceae bacterium]
MTPWAEATEEFAAGIGHLRINPSNRLVMPVAATGIRARRRANLEHAARAGRSADVD